MPANADTEFKRKAAARKGQATRLRNEADRAHKTSSAAQSRARAEVQEATARLYEAGRAFDIATGAALDARDKVVETVKPLSDPKQLFREFREELESNVAGYENRGAKQRRKLQRDADRAVKRVRERVPA